VGKLVVLRLGDGSFEDGFPVTLQIGEDGKSPAVEIQGKLPPTPEIPQYYSSWANTYRRLGLRSRLEASARQVTNVCKIETCCNTAQILRDRLNTWLCSEPFRPIREKLLEQLIPSDAIRIVIQTENSGLRRLPWHLWDLCDRYPKAEIALSAPVYERVEQLAPPHVKVRILAIIGNSVGINTQADRLLLEQLPDAEISFLVEPERQELTEELWRQGWDILFFAGHSSSHDNDETGRIYLNQTDSLTIDQLRYALRRSVERGLKIAIFNSCDGLGLARNLADLQIPQIIVMREPVPDRVSQEFLKYFLQAFARGESFYLAVREAREKLQGLEDRFPCATWLPMICQNPAVLPPTWQELGGSIMQESLSLVAEDSSPPDQAQPSPVHPTSKWWRSLLAGRLSLGKVVLMSLVTTSLVMLTRQLGLLQPLELKAFDQLMRSRPAEPPDSRLLVVTVTEEDIEAQQDELKKVNPPRSLSDRSLARLLEILESHQPRAIGLDIYRDFPVAAEYKDLARRMNSNNRLFVICQISNPQSNYPGVAPPPEIPAERHSFSTVVVDSDGALRRHLLAMTPPAASPCTPSRGLSTKLALRYLAEQGISPQTTADGYLQLGTTIFKPLDAHSGGYRNIDAWGHQVLLNYRSHRSPKDFVEQVTLRQVLNGQLNPNAVKDKIVLIGVTAPSRKDYFATPYSPYTTGLLLSKDMPGVILHAQMVSQIISAVLDRRPLLSVWPKWSEAIWIWSWALVGGVVSWRCKSVLRFGLVGGTLFILYSLCSGLLTQGYWVPLVPSTLTLVSTASGIFAYSTSQTKRLQSTFGLKS
jgi:CHASE2 domain-containing sensor protein